MDNVSGKCLLMKLLVQHTPFFFVGYPLKGAKSGGNYYSWNVQQFEGERDNDCGS